MLYTKLLFLFSLVCAAICADTPAGKVAKVAHGAGPLDAPDIEELVVVRQKDKYVARRYGSYAATKQSPVLNEGNDEL
ncbi:signal peptide-containing protein [Theileria equi strain WA]|uniref:Signal peptide-containing protein n=1 Tax=Theileria equi strain WA TaxID=1537102 RepID=L0B2D4_THEEQ|nr:signal peptide-containing protein [Theileria equi strain WA]AFZ81284.1 signal peptide-containing protein [Theileria equi strain WA]|eukprot:XP_004830950.1 signal peptide-containing protein [Theileria equi strain WA]